MFPTPAGALGLARLVPLPPEARVLDAGCGLGDGLRELHREYPQTQLAGVEWSWPLRLACAWRCRFRAHHARRPVGLGLVAAGSGLPLPAPGEHAARAGQSAPRAAPGRLAGQPRIRGAGAARQRRAAPRRRCRWVLPRPALKRPATIAGYRGRKPFRNRRRRAAGRTPCTARRRAPAAAAARPFRRWRAASRMPPSTRCCAPPSWRRPSRPTRSCSNTAASAASAPPPASTAAR